LCERLRYFPQVAMRTADEEVERVAAEMATAEEAAARSKERQSTNGKEQQTAQRALWDEKRKVQNLARTMRELDDAMQVSLC
jgi:hypothetical protein